MTQKEIKRVLDNKNTQTLIEFVDNTKKMSKCLMSTEFFHSTHTKRDREVICNLLMNFYDQQITIKRVGDDAVLITFL